MWVQQRLVLGLGLLAATSSGVAQGVAPEEDPEQDPRPPNVVLIVVDDAGYADFSFQGSPYMRTPRIDSLARDGVFFTAAYATSSVCSPSRAALLTGRYQQRFGHEFNPPRLLNRGYGLARSEVTLAEALRERDYRTIAVGKWHLGLGEGLHPLDQGFDDFYGFLLGGRRYLPFPEGKGNIFKRLQRDREPCEREDFTYLTDELGEAAAAYVDRFHEDPFFLYLAFNAVHGPLQAPESELAELRDLEGKRRTLAAMTASLDRAVGRVLDALEEHDLGEHTLLFFLSDNGGSVANGADNGPLRGHKGTSFEGGVRVPFLVRWPGFAPAGVTYDGTVSTLDVVPTVLSAVGASPSLDGVDLLPYLRGEREGSPHDVLYWRLGNLWGIRAGDWKALQEEQGEPLLFHLADDAGESTDLAAREPQRLAELMSLWEDWSSGLKLPRWKKYTMDDD